MRQLLINNIPYEINDLGDKIKLTNGNKEWYIHKDMNPATFIDGVLVGYCKKSKQVKIEDERGVLKLGKYFYIRNINDKIQILTNNGRFTSRLPDKVDGVIAILLDRGYYTIDNTFIHLSNQIGNIKVLSKIPSDNNISSGLYCYKNTLFGVTHSTVSVPYKYLYRIKGSRLSNEILDSFKIIKKVDTIHHLLQEVNS